MGLLKWFVERTKPLVWRLGAAYDFRIDRPYWGRGEHPLTFEDAVDVRRHTIPKTVVFNTRSGAIHVGADCVFSDDVYVLTGKHFTIAEAEATGQPLHHVPESGRDITIGRHCSFGKGAIVIGPATIGDYAVIAAGAVVTHDVPARSFVAGVPAKVVRHL